MSDANRVQLAYVAEPSDAFGEQVTSSALQILRYNSESLKQDMATTISEEIRSDRQISDVARIGLSASGAIDYELSYGSHDDFLKAALQAAAWSSEVKITRSWKISAADDNSINDSDSGFVNKGFAANQWVYVSGFSESANNGFFKISSVVAGKIIFFNGTLVTEAAGASAITVQMGSQIINEATLVSHNIEKDFKDITDPTTMLSLLKGMCINTMSLEVPADGIIKGNFGFLGSAEESLTEAGSGNSYTDETATVIMTGANHVTNFLEDLDEASILSFSMSLNNNLRTRLQVGTLGVASMGSGSVEITGSITLHLETATLFDKYLQQTVTSIVIAVRDVDGNGYVIEFPSVKIIDGTRSAGGLNTDVIGDFEFRAYMDASEGISIRIVRFPVMENFEGHVAATSSVSCSNVAGFDNDT